MTPAKSFTERLRDRVAIKNLKKSFLPRTFTRFPEIFRDLKFSLPTPT